MADYRAAVGPVWDSFRHGIAFLGERAR